MKKKEVRRNRLQEIIRTVKEHPELEKAQLNRQSPTGPLAGYIAGSQTAVIPDDIRDLGRRHILDTFASMVVSSRLKPARAARDFALFNGGRSDQAHILTTDRTTTLLHAIFANAIIAHAAEINDFCPSAFVQPGPPVVSTVFSIGETVKASGEEMLRAVITGYEIACRFPKALGLDNLQTAGLSSHGVGPTFGAAAAAASLLKIPEELIGDVMAYCVQQASGSYNWVRDEEHMEKAFLFAGMPARDGATAALLVHHGFTGVKDPFQGTPNWLLSSTFIGLDSDLDKDRLTRNLGVEFEMPLVAYKRYPVGGPVQASVEGLLTLIKKVERESIRQVDIKMPGNTAVFSGAAMPALNLPYLAAVILEDGDLTFDMAQSHERMSSASIQARMKFVTLTHDPSQEREPRVESALVKVALDTGRTEEVFIENVLGFPNRPMSREDVEAKTRSLITGLLGEAKLEQLIRLVWSLEEVRDIRDFIPLLIPEAE